MYNLSSETIYNSFLRLQNVSDKLGGFLCILSVLPKNVETNTCYELESIKLKSVLNSVFDLELKELSDS